MLDDDAAARRSLEQEAIALVNLSNPKQFRSPEVHADLEAETDAPSATDSKTTGDKSSSASASISSSPSSIHPLLRIKANLLARRDAKLRLHDATDVAEVGAASAAPESDVAIKMENGTAGMGTDQLNAEQLNAQLGLVDGNISMKSLLVTLKKRKLHHADQRQNDQLPTGQSANSETDKTDKTSGVETDASKLPSFRDVFQPQPAALPAAGASAAVATTTATSTTATLTTATSAELKCKYRTGKCHNIRALKSCGDYHNLCNYHRLRANANQRKLDRKKKVQRLQQQTAKPGAEVTRASTSTGVSAGSGVVGCSSRASSPRTVASQQSVASSQAAAAALASLVAARPHQQLQCPQYDAMLQQQQQRVTPSSGAVPDVVATGMSTDRRNRANSSGGSTPASCVRPKQEDACSY